MMLKLKYILKRVVEITYEIINLGGNKPCEVNYLISLIEEYLGKKAKVIYKPFHKADMKATWANIEKAKELLGWEPEVSLEEGIRRTVEWHIENREFLREISV